MAAALLTAKGYRILARRYAAHGGEIDLIARRGRTVAFIEVKARMSLDAAQEAIGAAKEQRFGRAVDAWLMRNGWAADHVLRADAVLIAPRRWPRHVENAFELGRS
ncbi:YraN family protein [Terrirubrum flagellatum]|uniref:YraN family protein n=1 Tax=Terrirubrum flagellatum TaxID=2895980 RepID=UPI003CC82FB7